MGRKPLDAARRVVELAELPLDAADFNQELYQSLENVFPEAELMPGLCILVLVQCLPKCSQCLAHCSVIVVTS